jgi:hypothetical protein
MHVVDGHCVSRCEECDSLCDAIPVFDASSLAYYTSKQCTVVVGDLILADFHDVTEAQLAAAFQSVRRITGMLVLRDIPNIVSLSFFRNLEAVQGRIVILNLPWLIDARLSALSTSNQTTDFAIEGSHRLCPAYYPLGSVQMNNSCTFRSVELFLHLHGVILTSFPSLVPAALSNTISVCNVETCSFCSPSLERSWSLSNRISYRKKR